MQKSRTQLMQLLRNLYLISQDRHSAPKIQGKLEDEERKKNNGALEPSKDKIGSS
jgi:pantothenate synthetase